MDENTMGRLATKIFNTVCPVCVDRNADGSCDRLEESSCTLLRKLPAAVDAILRVHSDRLEPYIRRLRANVCASCEHAGAEGCCDWRLTDNCMLECYLMLAVQSIEEQAAGV